MAHTIRGRVQIMLLLAWSLVVILIGFLSSAGGGKDPSPETLSPHTYSGKNGAGSREIPRHNTDKEEDRHYGE